MPTWLIVLLALVGSWIVGRAVWRARERRSFREAMLGGTPSFQVTVLDAPAGRVKVRVLLGGTHGPLRLVRLSTSRAAAAAVGLGVPAGFRPEPDSADAAWRPTGELLLRPGEPVELELTWDPSRATKPIAVQGWAEGEGPGGGFAVLVGPRAPAEIEAANRRSALLAEARSLGVPPGQLPGWAALKAEEARLAKASRGETA